MEQGGDLLQRARRKWLKQALLGGMAMPLLLRDVLAASERPNGLLQVKGEVLINGRPVKLGAA